MPTLFTHRLFLILVVPCADPAHPQTLSHIGRALCRPCSPIDPFSYWSRLVPTLFTHRPFLVLVAPCADPAHPPTLSHIGRALRRPCSPIDPFSYWSCPAPTLLTHRPFLVGVVPCADPAHPSTRVISKPSCLFLYQIIYRLENQLEPLSTTAFP